MAACQAFDAFLQADCGLPAALLMENAGAALAAALRRAARETGARKLLFLAGPGNNGGDALVAARQLAGDPEFKIQVCAPLGTASDPQSPSFQALRTLEAVGLALTAEPLQALLAQGPELLVDGLFGLGLSRPLTGPARLAVEAAAAQEAPVLAVDLPSGLDGESGLVLGAALPARWTLSFVAPKPGCFLGQGPRLCGRLEVAGIGVSPGFARAWYAARFERGATGE